MPNSPRPQFRARIERRNGKPFSVFSDPNSFWAHLEKLVGKDVVWTVKTLRAGRSGRQNRYYWGVVIDILAEEFGYAAHEREDLHAFLANKFLGVDRDTPLGPVRHVPSTTSLDTAEFEAYLEDIRVWAMTEHQVGVPLPNEIADF